MKLLELVTLIAVILVVLGGLNWGLVGAFNLNVVALIFAKLPIVARIIYVVIGIAAIYVGVTSINLVKQLKF
jgi:uncharacterized membrane protein YuzA (DUF378 family)